MLLRKSVEQRYRGSVVSMSSFHSPTDALRRITAEHPPAEGNPDLYARLLKAIRNGRLPVVKRGGRYLVAEGDFPRVAELLGLTEPNRPAA